MAVKAALSGAGITCAITGCEDEMPGVMDATWEKRLRALKGETVTVETIQSCEHPITEGNRAPRPAAKPMWMLVHISGPSGCGKTSLVNEICGLLKRNGISFDVGDPAPALFGKSHLIRSTEWDRNPSHSIGGVDATHVMVRTKLSGKRESGKDQP